MRELREGRRVPVVLVVVAGAELREHVVEDAVLEVRHPVPDLHGDDGRHRPDEHEARGQQHPDRRCETRTSRSAISVPSTDRQPDVGDREDDRAHERVPEDRVVQDGAVVVEPDPVALALDQLGQAVLLERERDELVERVAEDRRDRRRPPAGSGGTAPTRTRRRTGRGADVVRRRPPRSGGIGALGDDRHVSAGPTGSE